MSKPSALVPQTDCVQLEALKVQSKTGKIVITPREVKIEDAPEWATRDLYEFTLVSVDPRILVWELKRPRIDIHELPQDLPDDLQQTLLINLVIAPKQNKRNPSFGNKFYSSYGVATRV
jgi:hypothetical protein